MNIIQNLDLNPKIHQALKRASLESCETILSQSEPELERLTGLSAGDVHVLKNAVAEDIMKTNVLNGLEMWKNSAALGGSLFRRISTGCLVLDQALRGGLLTQGITEVVGESACGKTQLCLQLCLSVQLPWGLGGLGGGAVYICTEEAFPNKRLFQLIPHFKQRYPLQKSIAFGDNIFIEHIADVDDLMSCVSHRLPSLLARSRVRLVVVDSMAAPVRCQYQADQTASRTRHLGSLAAQLHHLVSQHGTAVVCVNQMTASMSGPPDGPYSVPALGLAWAHQVTTRLLLSRGEGCRRQLSVEFAPHLPRIAVSFIVDHQGVKGLPTESVT